MSAQRTIWGQTISQWESLLAGGSRARSKAIDTLATKNSEHLLRGGNPNLCAPFSELLLTSLRDGNRRVFEGIVKAGFIPTNKDALTTEVFVTGQVWALDALVRGELIHAPISEELISRAVRLRHLRIVRRARSLSNPASTQTPDPK